MQLLHEVNPDICRDTSAQRALGFCFGFKQRSAIIDSHDAGGIKGYICSLRLPMISDNIEPKPKREKAVKSICESGTVMKGLNIFKAGSDPIALPEAEYPAFLWKILDQSNIGEKKEARKTNRAQIKRKNFFSGKL